MARTQSRDGVAVHESTEHRVAILSETDLHRVADRRPPRVSIVIPCFRQGRLLAEAIDDGLGQDYPDVEVVVVNDGSDDGTAEVAASYGERIRYVAQRNAGLSAARNAGVRASAGDWLLFLDADDRLHSHAVASLLEAVGDDRCAVGVMGFSYFKSDPQKDGTPPILPPSNGSLRAFALKRISPPNSYLCPRQAIIDLGGFDESLRAVEDLEMWLRLADRGLRLRPTAFPGAYYRRYPGSMSGDRVRMGTAGAKVILSYLERNAGNVAIRKEVGGDLLRYLYAYRRKLRIAQVEPNIQQELTLAIDRLRRRGCRVAAALPVRFQDALPSRLGDAVERFGLWFFFHFRRSFYERL